LSLLTIWFRSDAEGAMRLGEKERDGRTVARRFIA
jgi:hypothetical protein